MNTKYIIAIVGVLLIGGGALLLMNDEQREAGSEMEQTRQNPLGDDAKIVGTVSESSPQATSTPSQTGGVTRVMIATHKTQDDCWVGYKGVAYDLTLWLPKHPGSAAVIAPYCGTVEEFTAALNRKHGTSKDGFIGKVGTPEGTINQ